MYEPFQVFLPYPSIWLGTEPAFADARDTSHLGLIVVLMGLFLALWTAGYAAFGLLLIMLLGSNPFILYEGYANTNVFAFPFIIAMLCLALAVPVMRKIRLSLLVAVAAAVTIGLIYGSTAGLLRPEIFPLVGGVALVFALMSNSTWVRRTGITLLFVAVAFLVHQSWSRYFSAKHAEAAALMKAIGGTVSPQGDRAQWFTVWVGLGDFDDKYGYLWDDRAAYYFFGVAVNANPSAQLDPILRADVLEHIREDPLWYARILTKRIWRVLAENTPPSIAVGRYQLRLPIPGALIAIGACVLIGVLLIGCEWFYLKLLFIPVALAATPLLIYSDHGVSYYSVVHLFIVAIGLALIGRGALLLLRTLGGRYRVTVRPIVGG
jgi:hypothetical protein